MFLKTSALSVASFLALTSCFAAQLNPDHKAYCEAAGGHVETLPARYFTASKVVLGDTKNFCTFDIDKGFVVIGLATFASDKSNIAATLTTQLHEISGDSSLYKGPYSNPSLNVCKNLGGASIPFLVNAGGFAGKSGDSDICVFGDGSMVSGWSLIYIANHRPGYDLVRNNVRSQPLDIKIPKISSIDTRN